MSIRAISYGSGVQSTALLVLAARREIDFPLALFANVGDDSEHPDTLRYFREVATPYAAEHGIELVELRKRPRGTETTLLQTLTRDGSRSIDIPMRLEGGRPGRRTCTTQFKVKRIASELKRRGASAGQPATSALGISLDEYQRMRSESGYPHIDLAYPLIDLRLDRADCVRFITDAGLPVPPKSSCWFCPFKRRDDWRRLRRETPDLFARAVELESTLAARSLALRGVPCYLSGVGRPLDQAIGDHDQLELFDGATCDIGGYCHA